MLSAPEGGRRKPPGPNLVLFSVPLLILSIQMQVASLHSGLPQTNLPRGTDQMWHHCGAACHPH